MVLLVSPRILQSRVKRTRKYSAKNWPIERRRSCRRGRRSNNISIEWVKTASHISWNTIRSTMDPICRFGTGLLVLRTGQKFQCLKLTTRSSISTYLLDRRLSVCLFIWFNVLGKSKSRCSHTISNDRFGWGWPSSREIGYHTWSIGSYVVSCQSSSRGHGHWLSECCRHLRISGISFLHCWCSARVINLDYKKTPSCILREL